MDPVPMSQCATPAPFAAINDMWFQKSPANIEEFPLPSTSPAADARQRRPLQAAHLAVCNMEALSDQRVTDSELILTKSRRGLK